MKAWGLFPMESIWDGNSQDFGTEKKRDLAQSEIPQI